MPYRLPLPLIPSPLYPARLPEGILHCHLNGSFEALCTHHQPDVANIFGKLSIGSNGIQNKPENQDEDVLWERSETLHQCLKHKHMKICPKIRPILPILQSIRSVTDAIFRSECWWPVPFTGCRPFLRWILSLPSH